MEDKKPNTTGKVATGLTLGAIFGAIAGLLFAPKSGKETREDIKKFAQDTKEKGEELFEGAKKEVAVKLENLKKAGKEINGDDYKKIVDEIVENFKGNGKITAEASKKLGEQLREDWEEVKKQITA
ncbi:MAG TPA: YtxH domain-containing protein [Candidatus Dojkabacteria bacterium]|nr:YtxH domain-containing protein [Candidatus Dojkabacteria bacterium]HQC39190.1 YtxH domain-containing protein [Candidatus Dojkabacteria bacterium]